MSANRKSTKRSSADPDDAPELTGAELSRHGANWKIGGKRVTAAKGKAAFGAALGKRQVNMMLDNAVVSHFKRRAAGRGYQTLINEALRESIEREALEKTLRRIVREELRKR
jgi:uncharacterized protein (DUF4415 family)